MPLSPLHNYLSLKVIKFFREHFTELPQYAVFDTSLLKTLPDHSKIYAIPYQFYKSGIKRYGFHGISYSYLLRKIAELLGKRVNEMNATILHLGNGASVCAIKEGKPIDTSM